MTLATGGTVADGTDGYRRHTFTTSADLVVSVGGAVSYLLVGGGGGAARSANANRPSGGAGGGAVKTGTPTLAAGTFPVVIGGGGAGWQAHSAGSGTSGTASTFNGVTAGGGGNSVQPVAAGAVATNGGGGGGGSCGLTDGSGQGGGNGTTGGGFNGGPGFGEDTITMRGGGGGGGAGQTGIAAVANAGGKGGDGITSSLSGTAVEYGGGGGGASSTTGTTGAGSTGGSGAAAISAGTGSPNAVANRGGGGGGCSGNILNQWGGNGGSGLAIVRYIAPLTVTDAGDELYLNGDAVTITGTNFIATQGTGRVVISPTDNIADGSAVAQTVTGWANGSVNVTIVRGSLPYVSTVYLFVENDLDASNPSGYPVAFQAPTPTITNADDEAFNSGGEAYTVTGTGFLPTQGAGSVIISATDNVNDAGAVTQGVSSWSDTSIGATSNQASLASGVTLYLFVKNAGLVANSSGYPVQFNFAPVTITDAGDELYEAAEAVTITGAGFLSLQGAGFVKISPTDNIADGAAVTQTVTSWGSTSIQITVVQGALPIGPTLYLFVQNNVGTSNVTGYPVVFVTAPPVTPGDGEGWEFIEGVEGSEFIEGIQ